jgi:gliding motility-associated-like protein
VLSASQTVFSPLARISGDSLLCAGRVGTLTVSTSATATAYRWNTGAATPSIAITQAGVYTAEVSYATCTSTARFVVRSLPGFSLGRDTTLCEGETLLLQAPALAAGTGLTYQWSDGSTGSTLLVRASGQYSVRLLGSCDQQLMSRTVRFESCVFLPNVITPNGDLRNERWVLQGLPAGSCAVELYNRWGRKVYESAAYRNDWGGEGVGGLYYYVVKLNERVYRGWLEVVL